MKIIIIFFLLIILQSNILLFAKIIDVSPSGTYSNLNLASEIAVAGDTILFHGGVYSGGQYIDNLQGTNNKWINILGKTGEEVVIKGSGEAWHLTDAAFILISGIIFEGQTSNGVNIDDGGSYETPSHHIIIENCIWRGMDAGGNNDELKMSGVDSAIIRKCRFYNGSAGGSLIDMVGCHWIQFEDNYFKNAGSNCIQAKGGSSGVNIIRNSFINGGQRAINIGGSTGEPYFRPKGVLYEAKDIAVYTNIFIGSLSPVAFVGAIDCNVINNTIINPEKWAIRILQENIAEGFQKCSNNSFINNIIYFGNKANNEAGINIGPNTEPATFLFMNNLWYNFENINWGGPNKAVTHLNSILNQGPEFISITDTNFALKATSPAIGKGKSVQQPKTDFLNHSFNNTPSIGAIEYIPDNQFSFSMVTNDTIIGKPGDMIQFEAKFRNLTHNDVYIIIKRTQQNLPPKWVSQYCAGNCFPPEIDSSSLYISPDDTQAFTLDIYTNEIEGEGAATFTFESKDNPENKFTQTFHAITRNETSITDFDNSAMKLEVYPNPVNQASVVSCLLPVAGQVKLSMYNLMGDEVAVLYEGYCESEHFNYQFSIINFQLSNGYYFLRVATLDKYIVKPIIIIR